ncbi:DNA methyltransferase [Lachnospiraceae bacterium KK002]
MSEKEQIVEVETLPDEILQGATYVIQQPNPNSYTHGMFKYPCKFIPELPGWGIRTCARREEDIVFDPFSGSGTTLLEANLRGFHACGTEIDDIAKLIIKVKTTPLNKEQMKLLDEEFQRILDRTFRGNGMCYRPEIDNLEHWFSPEVIAELGRMRICTETITEQAVRDFFHLCMVSIIKKVSNADDTSPKPYVSNKVKKIPPPVEREFTSVFRRYRQMVAELSAVEHLGTTRILAGDALDFSVPGGIGLAVTSPPYINAFDYGRTMRLENLWLGTLTEDSLREKKKQYVGTEKINAKEEDQRLDILEKSSLLKEYYGKIAVQDRKRALIVKKFFEDMETNLKAVRSQMEPGGRYMIVIGNSTIRKVTVESWRVLEEIACTAGYRTWSRFSYVIQNPYIRIPRKGMGGKIGRDYVLVLERV